MTGAAEIDAGNKRIYDYIREAIDVAKEVANLRKQNKKLGKKL